MNKSAIKLRTGQDGFPIMIGSRAVSAVERAIYAHKAAARLLRNRKTPDRIRAERQAFNTLAKMIPADGVEAGRFVRYMVRAIPRRLGIVLPKSAR